MNHLLYHLSTNARFYQLRKNTKSHKNQQKNQFFSGLYHNYAQKIYNKQIQNVESTCFTRKININLNVQTNLDLPIDQPWQGGKSQTAPSLFHYAVTSQGEAQRNPGNMTSNYINQDRHWRIWRSGTEWHIRQCDDFPEVIASTMNPVPAERLQRGGCHRAMLFYILPQGYASLTLGCLTLAALSGLVFRQAMRHSDVASFLTWIRDYLNWKDINLKLS